MANVSDRNRGSLQEQRREEGEGLTGMASAAWERTKETASNLTEKAADVWDTTRQTATEWGGAVAEGAEETWDSVNSFFRRYAVPMFFVGIGLGFLLSRGLGSEGSRR